MDNLSPRQGMLSLPVVSLVEGSKHPLEPPRSFRAVCRASTGYRVTNILSVRPFAGVAIGIIRRRA